MLETQILDGLITNETYAKKSLPYLEEKYFDKDSDRIAFRLIRDYINKYGNLPTTTALQVDLQNLTDISGTQFKESEKVIQELKTPSVDQDWLIDQTEKFCQDKALFHALMDAIKIADEKPGTATGLARGAIPSLLQDALGVSFNNSIGHEFMADADARFEFYHRDEEKIPFDIQRFNDITGGGLPRKTLTCIIGGTGAGKTMTMCHFAASHLVKGYNVLYITLEMSEERIAQRIDANLLDSTIHELEEMSKITYDKKIDRLRQRTTGKLLIKEFPTAGASVNNFRHLLMELKHKKNFVPDVIYVDYINICASSRVRLGSSVNSYSYIKAITEELRGLAIQTNTAMITATQVNRSGYTNPDPGMENTSDSFGIPMTLDLMFAIITTEELEQQKLLKIKQFKNRFNDVNYYKTFTIGIDRPKMRLLDLTTTALGTTLPPPGASSWKESSNLTADVFEKKEKPNSLLSNKDFSKFNME